MGPSWIGLVPDCPTEAGSDLNLGNLPDRQFELFVTSRPFLSSFMVWQGALSWGGGHCHLESALAITGCAWSAMVFEWVVCEA